MNSKKKIIIAVSALAMVLIASVVAVVAVLAAQQVTVQSNVQIVYTTKEIQGSISAYYQVKGDASRTQIGSTVTPDGSEPDNTGFEHNSTSAAVSIENLSKTNNYVDFIFTFTNTGSTAYKAQLTGNPNWSTNGFTTTYSAALDGDPTGSSAVTVTIPANTTTAVEYTVRYTLGTFNTSFTVDGQFEWKLVADGADSVS